MAGNGGLPYITATVSDAKFRSNFNGIFKTRTVFTFLQIVTAPYVVNCPNFVVSDPESVSHCSVCFMSICDVFCFTDAKPFNVRSQ